VTTVQGNDYRMFSFVMLMFQGFLSASRFTAPEHFCTRSTALRRVLRGWGC
jgi:hypothetical protein